MPGWQWNVFDSLVVLAQIAEEVLNVISLNSSSNLPNFSFMRVLRVLRLIRIVRLVRILRFIGELRTLVTSIMSSLKSLAWTVVLLFLIIYSVSVYLTQVVVDHSYESSLDTFYGDLLMSMLTLFQSVTGGLDWNDALRPLTDEIHPMLALVLGVYIAFTVLAVMNVVTGVFVESALLSANHDQAMYMVNNMRELFLKANDGNPCGSMVWEKFKTLLGTKQMRDFFKAIDVDMNVHAAHSIFQLLDMDKSGSIELDEFVTGCSRLRGQARALDINVMLYEMREMSSTMRRRFHAETKRLVQMGQSLKGLSRPVSRHGEGEDELDWTGARSESTIVNEIHGGLAGVVRSSTKNSTALGHATKSRDSIESSFQSEPSAPKHFDKIEEFGNSHSVISLLCSAGHDDKGHADDTAHKTMPPAGTSDGTWSSLESQP